MALNILRLEYTKHIDTNDILDIMHAPNLDSSALDSLEMSCISAKVYLAPIMLLGY